jgi:NAD(P)-dependent dehydrogenase (short-subunit alcohol dehydrogenase family)
MPTDPIYAGTKAAVVNLTQSCAGLLQSHNIRVNAVLPGMVATPFIEKTGDGEQPAAWLKPILGQIPMLSADQIAEGIIQLVLDQSSAGACLVIENPTKPGGPPLKTLLPDAKSFYRYQLSR